MEHRELVLVTVIDDMKVQKELETDAVKFWLQVRKLDSLMGAPKYKNQYQLLMLTVNVCLALWEESRLITVPH